MKLTAAILFVLTVPALASAGGWVIENEDNDHYFYSGKEGATKEALEAYADSLLEGGHVTHLFWCVNGQRPNYDSKVWDPIWKALEDKEVQWGYCSKVWPTCAKTLFDEGIDPYRVWIDRTRAKGASPWVSMRMNDNHDGWLAHGARVCQWYKDHPQFRILPGYKGVQWGPYSLDFAHPEVRDYTFALFEEIVNRYADADGIEMDFLRASNYFKDEEAVTNAPVMTAFIARCRAAANAVGAKRGRPYQLAIRLPITLDGALKAGFDAVEIARQGLCDVIIVCSESRDYTDWEIPFGAWKAKVGAVNPKIRLVAGTTAWSHNPASLKGWTAMMRDRGAEDFYVFNLQWANEALKKAVHPGAAFAADVCTKGARAFYVDTRTPPMPQLPPVVVKGEFAKAAFRPGAWTYAANGAAPRAIDFSKRLNLRKGQAPDGKDYPPLTKLRLTGVLESEKDGEALLGMGFDWRWELFVNGQNVFGRTAMVDARDRGVLGRASDWTVAVPVKKGANVVVVEIVAGENCFGEMKALDPAAYKDGVDLAAQRDYEARVKSGEAVRPYLPRFPYALAKSGAFPLALPKDVRAESSAVVELTLTKQEDAPVTVRLNGQTAKGELVVDKKVVRIRAAFPLTALKGGVAEIAFDGVPNSSAKVTSIGLLLD